jgi:LuxR family quorum-sensing transcriptional regulator LasR
MLVPIEPNAAVPEDSLRLSPWLGPLIDASRAGDPLVPAVQTITQSMGFSTFLYAAGAGSAARREERFFVWTSAPRAWIEEYDANGYVEIDPCVAHGWPLWQPPLVWDSALGHGSASGQRFLQRAACFGIGSGLAIYLRDGPSRIMFALSRPERTLTPMLRAGVAAAAAQAMYLANVLHCVFLDKAPGAAAAPPHPGSPLSARERQCLQLAANGMTSFDIGEKLGIAERTANYHFSNILKKLGVLNRNEAIAKGVFHGLVQPDAAAVPMIAAPPSKIRDAQLKRWETLRNARRQPSPR